jgi:hypothetical protein
MLPETYDPVTLHKLTSTFPAFPFRVEPVLGIETAVGAELAAVAWRDGVAG